MNLRKGLELLLMNLRKSLELLLKKINANKTIVKPADKVFITVVMTPNGYWNMCYRPFSDTKCFNNLDNNNPPTVVEDRVNKFAEKHKSILANKKYKFLTKHCHKILIFYMLPKLHKSKEINEIIEIRRTEYV